jgi:excisionase family DNA binding protein
MRNFVECSMEKLGFSLMEAAKLTSVSTFTLRREIKRGNLKIARVGRRVVVPFAELEKLLRPQAPPNEITTVGE